MDLDLKGKRAVVMAASMGLGRAAALELARSGASVAICARKEERLMETAAAIREETGAKVEPVVADVARPADIKRFLDTALMEFGQGGLDILVTNTGGPPAGRFMDHDDAAWQAAFEQVVMGPVRAIRAAVPHMARGGSIVAVTSSSVKQPIPNLVLSNSLRAAVTGMMKTLSQELGEDGIRVNCVMPGSMATGRITDLLRHQANASGITLEEAEAAKQRSIPLGRFGEPAELGRAIAWLASPAASYVTGVTLAVDGGAIQCW